MQPKMSNAWTYIFKKDTNDYGETEAVERKLQVTSGKNMNKMAKTK